MLCTSTFSPVRPVICPELKKISKSAFQMKRKRGKVQASAGFKEGDKLVNKTIVVTGSNRGIGLEFVRQLAKADNTVIAACRSPESAGELQALAGQFPEGRVLLTKLDILQQEKGAREWAESLQEQGISHVDVCINNAGVVGTASYNKWDIGSVDAEEMLYCFKVNTMGPLLVAQQLREAGLIGPPGSLLANMSSKVGSVDDNGSGGGYAYRASKSALNIVNKSMSVDLQSEKIISLLLHPGYVKTDMTGGAGFINTKTSVEGLIRVMEGEAGPLNGNWYDFALKAIPW